ncbi:MAG TPA: arylsulfatase [Acidimicrobiia bacterium]|nr:arylsulfatase [Acidimicrobiia bacterium]
MSDQTVGDDAPSDGTEAYAGFQGRVGRTFAGSEGWWPPRAVAPEGAPNVVIVLVDDLGFADVGCFGAEIDTPNIDALAAAGLRYTNFHSAPMCSPTRAALLTGLNPHDAGLGSVAHSDAGFPGYAMELAPNAATMAEILRDQGYATFMVGKWHLSKDSDQSDGAPKHSWPCQRGFDRYYGVLDAFTNLHQPHRLVEDNHPVEIDQYPDDYFFTDDITDRAISMVRSLKASDPTKPFLLYLAHGAVHAPLHAKPADIAKYRGRYDAGWDAIREERWRRQQELGVVPRGLPLPPRNSEPNLDVPAWDDLSEDEQRLFARYMEVYAGMVDNIDQNLGRLLDALDELGERENTVVIFTSDNGASREGEAVGTTAYYVHLLLGEDIDADLARIDEIGGPTTIPHYPRGWAMAGNTPWRLYKINTHAGGHTVPTIVSWPARLREQAGGLRDQYVHVTDVLPTLLDVLGVEAPRERGGVALKRMVGSSFLPTLADAGAPSEHTEQHYESWGSKGFYRDGWEVVTNHQPMTPFTDEEWELYDLRADRNQLHDLRSEHPERLRELADAWEQAAWANQVFPLDEGSSVRYLIRPPRNAVYTEHPIVIPRGTPTLERWRSVQLIWFRAFRVSVALDFRAGDQGVLVAHGDQGGGYALYVLDDTLHFAHNDGRGHMRSVSGGPIPSGTKEIVADFAAPGKNLWTLTLSADGVPLATLEEVPMLYGIAPFEGIDVGIDRRSPVSWALYERFGPFPFTGTLHSVRYEPGAPAPDSPNLMIDLLRELGSKYE